MPSRTPTTVFIVDDDNDSQELLLKLVRSCSWYAAGYNTEQICQGALSILSADCILLDLTPPDMAGLKVLDVLRQHGVRTPVVAVIANADADSIQRASAAGMRGALRKPVKLEGLRSTVEQAIIRYQASERLDPPPALKPKKLSAAD